MMKSYFIFLISLSLCFSVYGNPKLSKENPVTSKQSYKGFVKRVSEIYENLVFNNAKLSFNNVTLKNIQSGIAFAYFDKKTTKRYILLNYAYLYRHLADFDSTKKSQENILKAIIAHEWAHHYLAHIFEGQSIINERNADIMAGRILAQNGVDNKSITSIKYLFSKYRDIQHLNGDIRASLIDKGFITESIINDGCLNRKELAKIFENFTTTLKESKRISIQAVFNNDRKKQQDSLITVINTHIISFFKQIADSSNIKDVDTATDTLTKILSVKYANDKFSFTNDIKEYPSFLSKEKKDSLNLLINNFGLIIYAINSQNQQNLYKKLLTVQSISLSLDDLIKAIQNTLTKDQIDALEILYNTIFIKKFIKSSGINCNLKPNEENAVLEYFSKQNPSPLHTYDYQLKGPITVRFNLKEKNLRINQINYKAYLSADGNDKPFPYTFKTKDGTFFIDKFNQLWTENVGAQPIDNKIFLQRHNLK